MHTRIKRFWEAIRPYVGLLSFLGAVTNAPANAQRLWQGLAFLDHPVLWWVLLLLATVSLGWWTADFKTGVRRTPLKVYRDWQRRRLFWPLEWHFHLGSRPGNPGLHVTCFDAGARNRATSEEVAIEDAYLVSRMTGQRLALLSQVTGPAWVAPNQVAPIQAGGHLALAQTFDGTLPRSQNPGIPAQAFVNDWGEFDFVVVYGGRTRRREFKYADVREWLIQSIPAPQYGKRPVKV